MSSKLKLTIKDFPIRGGNFSFQITSAGVGQKFVSSVRVPKLTITRTTKAYSIHFFMMAQLRRLNPQAPNAALSQITVTFDKYDANGKFISGTTTDFFDVVVENVKPNGNEEEITFLADRKSGDLTISNIEVRLD